MSTAATECRACHTPLPPDATSCPACGAEAGNDWQPRTGSFADTPGSVQWTRLQAALGPTCELRRFVGRGGFADVYAGWDVRLKREIAVKTIRGDLVVSASMLQRFQREAESVARIRHPHIIPIFWVGEATDVAYFTMPLIEGTTLATELERASVLDSALACRVITECAQALAAAHRAGVIHRDVKPDNIMLEGRERRVVLMDFGIAMTAGAEGGGLTGTGIVVGTPQYMSPEQAIGDRSIGPASDQYSLAVVGYRALTGRLPFEGRTLTALLASHSTAAAQPIRELRPEVPADLEAALMRALAVRPEDRFPATEEFVAALEAAGAGLAPEPGSVGARPISMYERVERARQLTARWWLVAVVSMVLGIGVAFWLRDLAEPRWPRTLAGHREEARYAAQAFLAARGATGEFVDVLEFNWDLYGGRFLSAALGPRAVLARTDVELWYWSLTRVDEPRHEVWRASVGRNNRILSFYHGRLDSVSATRIQVDSARRIATRMLLEQGQRPESLVILDETSSIHANRSVHSFRWTRAGWAVRLGGDSALSGFITSVRGDSVYSYFEFVTPPESYNAGERAWIRTSALATAVILGLTMFVMAAALAFQRRHETPHWSGALRVSMIVVVLFAAGYQIPRFYGATTPGWVGDTRGNEAIWFVNQHIPLLAGAFVVVLLASVVGLSVSAETRPWSAMGLAELARLRWRFPELTTGTLIGYGAGAAMLAIKTALEALALASGVAFRLRISYGFSLAAPWLELLPNIALAITVGVAGLMVVVLGDRRQLRPPIPEIALALLVVAVRVSVAGEPLALASIEAMLVGCAVALVRRFGVIAGIAAFFVVVAVPDAFDMLAAERAPFVSAGLIELAVLAVPLLLAFRNWRRFTALRT